MMGTISRIAETRIGKVLIGLWLFALVIFISVPVTGLFEGELLGSLAFSVLPVAILLNISIVLAHFVEKGSVAIAKVAWISIGVVALLIALFAFDGKPNSDIGIFLAWFTLVLAFPISWLVALLLTGVAIAGEKLFSAVIPTSYLSLSMSWLCFIAAGYWQWFVLLPWACRKWKTRRAPDATRSL
jgi:hypothetical protein